MSTKTKEMEDLDAACAELKKRIENEKTRTTKRVVCKKGKYGYCVFIRNAR